MKEIVKNADFKARLTQNSSKSNRVSLFFDYVRTVLLGAAPESRTNLAVVAPSKLQILLWSLLLLTSLVLFLEKYGEFQIGSYQDDAIYIVLANSLVHSETYGLINRPGEPAGTQFPFGLPLLLAPFIWLFPANTDALRVVSLLATLANSSLLFWGWHSFSRRRSLWWGLAVAGLYTFSPLVVDQSRMVMSEPIFTMFCLTSLLLGEQAAQRRESRVWPLLMGISLFFALFIRTIGFTLVVPIFFYLLWKRGLRFWKSFLLVGLTVALLVATVLISTSVQSKDLLPSKYIDQFAEGGTSEVVDRLFGNQIYKLKDQVALYLYQLLIPFGGGHTEERIYASFGLGDLPIVFRLCLLGLTGLGFLAWVRQEGFSGFNIFPVVYLGIIYSWSWDGRRFLYPIQPELQFAFLFGVEAIIFWIGMHSLGKEQSRRLTSVGLFVLVCLLLLGGLYKGIRLDRSALHVGDVYARSNWLKDNTLVMDIIMTDQPEVDFVNSGRRTMPFRDAYASAAELQQDLADYQVKYVLVAPALDWQVTYRPTYSPQLQFARPLLNALIAQNRLAVVYASSQDLVQILKVQP
jgi:4-amino-4-deoxy-L-arabinose transferase-like glycosyltransferase